jgi:aspartate 1-decarboxylase
MKSMRRTLIKSKIQNAVVTEAQLDYEGSLGIDVRLLRAADMIPYEKVHIYNVTNGERFSTYLIEEAEGSGKVAIYGAAAHKAGPGDCIIIVSFALFEEGEIPGFRPKIVIAGPDNRIKSIR